MSTKWSEVSDGWLVEQILLHSAPPPWMLMPLHTEIDNYHGNHIQVVHLTSAQSSLDNIACGLFVF